MTRSAPCFRLGVDDPAAITWLRGTRAARGLYQLIPGRTMRSYTTAEGKLLALRYLNGSTVIRIERSGESFSVASSPSRWNDASR